MTAVRSDAAATPPPAGLPLLAVRRILEPAIVARFPLSPGDQLLVGPGEAVLPGTALAGRLREAAVREVGRHFRAPGGHAVFAEPGQRWSETRGQRELTDPVGEHLFEVGGRWRVVAGEMAELIEAPLAGTVEDVQPGIGLTVRMAASGLRASYVLGGPVRGRLAIAAGPGGELRASAIDVGRAGQILVVGARIDAEALTRARAMGVRGVIVAGLPSKERRDFLASEARQRAARQRLPPFAVAVLGGPLRRPIASPLLAILRALEGQDIAILGWPPVVAFADPGLDLPLPSPDHVRIRTGPLLGVEGRWAGLAGPRRFPGGVMLEAGLVELDDGSRAVVPLGDLERFA